MKKFSLLILSFFLPIHSFLHHRYQYFPLTTCTLYSLNNPRVDFEYCTGCRWLLRSAWLAQELLTTFEKDLSEVALIPSKGEAGTFIIRLNGQEIWDRKKQGFPDIKDLKQLVRDKVDPSKNLGHSDRKT
jgi:selenoprotein W-related protein